MRTLKTFDSDFTAHIWKEKMEANGIICYLQNENLTNLMPALNMATGGIRLVTDDMNFENALIVLKELEEEYLNSICCPGCGHKGMDYIAKPTVVNLLTEFTTWFFGSYAMAANYIYKCPHCNLEAETVEVDNKVPA